MLSFFSKKKNTPPDTPPEEVIPGPAQENNGDDFIFVDRRSNHQEPTQDVMYPPMPPAPFGLPYPVSPYPRTVNPDNAQDSTLVPYIQGVPFELHEQLNIASSYETVQTQVDGILALMTRQMSVDETDIYNFTLERTVQKESEVY